MTIETFCHEVTFGAKVVPGSQGVRMELWLANGSEKPLGGLRVQNCVMLKGMAGFTQLTNDNKRYQPPYAACRNSEGDRWIIVAWDRCLRAWGNDRCPCLHSDPQFPDGLPGETHRLQGWLSFYSGTNIEKELTRLDELGWRE